MIYCLLVFVFFFFFKQKTAYEMRISDWSSDVCSSDLREGFAHAEQIGLQVRRDDFAALIAEETEADDGVDIDAARDRRMTQLGQHVAPTVDAIDLETLDGSEQIGRAHV